MRTLLSATVLVTIISASAFAECNSANFCVEPEFPNVGEVVKFEAGLDLFAGPSTASFKWFLGNKVVEGPRQETAETTYTEPGNHTVRLYVISKYGTVESRERTISVDSNGTSSGKAETNEGLYRLDTNGNQILDDAEFMTAIDLWINERLRNDLFMAAIDCWIQDPRLLKCELRRKDLL